jgi:glutamate-1-semialdehyde 2,1-aminomutase
MCFPVENTQSARLFERAKKVAPGGVHSDFRNAFPVFFESANGSRIVDVDRNSFIDYHNAFGAILLGHRNPKVMNAVREQLECGDLWGMGSNELELEVAEKIVRNVPSADKVRFCNSGSEGTYHAVRLARACTRKRKIIKFEGSYNGWHDYLDVGVFPSADSLDMNSPNSAGILQEASEQTLVVPYNNIPAFERTVREHENDIAAVIVEPILHSCGCILPKDGFLKSIREITYKHSIVLIFDEVITGFRHALGGAQDLLKITPNLTVLAKAIANGFPAAAVCGEEELMNQIEPVGKVHMAGTFSAHSISMAAAKATIEQLEGGKIHETLERSGDFLQRGLTEIIREENVPAQVSRFRSVFAIYFTDKRIENYRDLKANNDEELFKLYCQKMREQGIFIPPQAYKRSHITAAHSVDDLKATVKAARVALHECKLQFKEKAVVSARH